MAEKVHLHYVDIKEELKEKDSKDSSVPLPNCKCGFFSRKTIDTICDYVNVMEVVRSVIENKLEFGIFSKHSGRFIDKVSISIMDVVASDNILGLALIVKQAVASTLIRRGNIEIKEGKVFFIENSLLEGLKDGCGL